MAAARSTRSTSSSSGCSPARSIRARCCGSNPLAADLKDGSGDERLDAVLAEIDLRVAVELAKAGMI